MDLFVYGTLQSAALMRSVAGPGRFEAVDAVLENHTVSKVAGQVVPFISPSKGQTASGCIWKDLSHAQVCRLDTYESAFGYCLGVVKVLVDGAPRKAWCYLPPNGVSAEPVDWSLTDWEAGHLSAAVSAAEELFALDVLPSAPALRRMWPMIEGRAWAKRRAVSDDPAPATVRFRSTSADFSVVAKHPPLGQFFRLQPFDVEHKTFSGGRSDVLRREVFMGADAALVLPYDPIRDRVLLVEQIRMGPLMRDDPNPWTLEPVAGMVDARETPEQAALRETHEEAGLELHKLELITQSYASPGGATDYFYHYLGLCDLPDLEKYTGGVQTEAEDLHLHIIGFEEALALADNGEITAAPLVLMLNWLARHRERLRSTS